MMIEDKCKQDFLTFRSLNLTKIKKVINMFFKLKKVLYRFLDSIVVSIPACHAGDRGSIPRRGDFLILSLQRYRGKANFQSSFQ